ncbi:hypothetical protein SD77_2188 [Bacillus badius]|uniref:Ribose 5-phosphate isomerase B n=1 Tax=Bacillus badius TaxID=1455 RepID=A0ABR5AYH7_BACBA|nr:hypothetical protein SD77_2188 [Bacillus badius]
MKNSDRRTASPGQPPDCSFISFDSSRSRVYNRNQRMFY